MPPPPPHMDGIAHTQTRFVDATRNGGMGWEEARESRDDDGIIFAKPTNGTTPPENFGNLLSLPRLPSRIRAPGVSEAFGSRP